MKKTICLLVAAVLLSSSLAFGEDDTEHRKRFREATTVVNEVMATPDQAIPQRLIERAHCLVVVPGVKKAAFIVGARYGKGYLSCRKASVVGWTAPGTVRIEGGSIGFQIGGAETDIVLLVMNQGGLDRLLTSQFTIGGAAEAAAGPVGRAAEAQSDALLTAQILSWSRARGVFAGISLQGATLRQDVSDNRSLYGRTLENREIIERELPIPQAAGKFISALNHYSSR